MKKYKVTLTEDERSELKVILSKGSHRSQKVLNALILLSCDEGEYQESRSINEVVASVLPPIPHIKPQKCFHKLS